MLEKGRVTLWLEMLEKGRVHLWLEKYVDYANSMYHFRMSLLIFSIAVIAFLSSSGTGLTDKSRFKLTYCWMLRDSAEYYEYRLDTKCYLAVDFFDQQVIKQMF
jgi:hypothetical protein